MKLIAKYAGSKTITADGVTYSSSELQDKYTALAKALRDAYARSTGSAGVPVFGDNRVDTDVPLFGLGQFDNLREGVYEDRRGGRFEPDWAD